MAKGGLLSRIMRSPELMAALGLGGYGYMTADEDENEIARALAGAAMGTGGGMAMRGVGKATKGLLGRAMTAAITPEDKTAKAIAARKALGQTGSAATQFPSANAMSALDEYADLRAMEKYGDKIGKSKLDLVGDGLDEIGQFGTKVWDGIDAIAHRAAPIDRMKDLKNALIPSAMIAGGAGTAYTVYELVNSGNRAKDEATRAKLLTAVGVDPTPTGLMLFQAKNGLEPSGQWDDRTIMAIAKALEGAEQQEAGPPAPSLAPHNQR